MTVDRADVLLVGSPHWCRHLKDVLNQHGGLRCHTIGGAFRWMFAPARSICLVGVGPPDTVKRRVYHVAAFLLQRVHIARLRVLYWIGSDVMRLLREAGLIDCERQGQWAYYFLKRDAVAALQSRVGGLLQVLG